MRPWAISSAADSRRRDMLRLLTQLAKVPKNRRFFVAISILSIVRLRGNLKLSLFVNALARTGYANSIGPVIRPNGNWKVELTWNLIVFTVLGTLRAG